MTENSTEVRVAIVGVGNCASSLVQGVQYYQDADENATVPGLMHVQARPVPRARRQVRRRVRRRRQEGRLRPVRGDLRVGEQHHQDRRRAADQRHGAARPDPRRHRQVLRRDHRGLRRRGRSTSSRRSRTPRSTCWCPTCRWAPRRPTSSTPSAPSTPVWRSSTRCRCSSRRTRCGPRSSRTPACRSSATTSRARSAPPSPTA